MSVVLILGSGPNVVESQGWDGALFDDILAINNAWQVRPDWTHLIHPEDFPTHRHPPAIAQNQKVIRAADYVPAMNAYGGVIYQGGTMAYTAGYWALHHFRPKVLAYIGCDMDYAKEVTHFYGTGTADPLRDDVTLQSLEAKSARLMLLAAQQDCAVVNLSTDRSRLVFPRAAPDTLRLIRAVLPSTGDIDAALAREKHLGYAAPDGRYWQNSGKWDACALRALDTLWLEAARGYMLHEHQNRRPPA